MRHPPSLLRAEPPRAFRSRRLLIAILVLVAASGCRSRQEVVSRQQKALTSLRATTLATCEAWLAGAVSTAYARTTLETTRRLVEKQRAALAGSSPDFLADAAVQSVSDAQSELARTLVLLWKAMDGGDAAAVRRHLAAVASDQSGAHGAGGSGGAKPPV